MTYKLDYWRDTLPAIDRGRMDYYARLSPEGRKAYSFPVVLRAASAVKGNPDVRDWYLLSINDRVNRHGALVTKHPELQHKLLASCGLGDQVNHPWIPMPKRATPNHTLYDFIRENWTGANELECEIILKQIDQEKLISLIREAGLDPDRSKEVVEAYERHIGKRSKAKGKSKAKGGGKKR